MADLLVFSNIVRTLNQGANRINVSGRLEEGQLLLLEGPSGSGKSTLLRILARLLQADSGSLYFKGRSSQLYPAVEWRRRIKYSGQKPVIFPGTMEDNLRMPFALGSVSRDLQFDRQVCLEYMNRLGLDSHLMEQEAGKLSGGEAARMALIRSLAIEPEVLLLDEPTAYLDADSRGRVLDLIRGWLMNKPRNGVIMVSHNQEEVMDFENIARLHIRSESGGEEI